MATFPADGADVHGGHAPRDQGDGSEGRMARAASTDVRGDRPGHVPADQAPVRAEAQTGETRRVPHRSHGGGEPARRTPEPGPDRLQVRETNMLAPSKPRVRSWPTAYEAALAMALAQLREFTA